MADIGSGAMLQQYRRIKHENPGSVLFFRLGDFYEMFAEDALEVSALLNLTLTKRNGIPMCGIPYHASHAYIGRLLKCGKKIAVCEQVSDARSKGKKLMERRVLEVITPGTTVDEDYLDRGRPNYLAALAASGGSCSFAYVDLSSGGFFATSFPLDDGSGRLAQELERLQVREMLVQESLLAENGRVAAALADRPGLVLNRWADWLFDAEGAAARLRRQFGVSGLKGFGLSDGSPETLAAGALLQYLDGTSGGMLPHVRSLGIYGEDEFVGIDEASQRNLELVRNLRDGSERFTLLEVMDRTGCSMGKRLLRHRVLHPLRDPERIRARLRVIETFHADRGNLGLVRELLSRMPDLQRLSSRLAMDRAHGRDMLAIRNALFLAADLTRIGRKLGLVPEAGDVGAGEEGLADLAGLLDRAICDEPSILLTEGKLIRPGYNEALDSLHKLRDSGREFLEAYLEKEKAATGILGLKMRYNRLIGYFFEVAKGQLHRVPAHFIRRQGVAGAERFGTERLAALESDINGAQDRIFALERDLFLELREKAKEFLPALAARSAAIAELDVGQSLAEAALLYGWVCPELDDSGILRVKAARHPVVQAHLESGAFIPNDIELRSAGAARDGEPELPSFAMITGPNMAGKSTYLRSAALIAVMAQAGSFVPAREARIGLCDRIFCRVGAQDNLARGESTFLVEMNETACILNTARRRSLVIMDEVGRGTGTNDGLSLAWAISEELLDGIGCRVFFATHYHELSLLVHPSLVNRSMEVLEEGGRILFTRKLREGPASESYGIHVASLAGIPKKVLDRAGTVMARLRERGPASLSSEVMAGMPAEVAPVTPETRNPREKEPAGRQDAAWLLRELENADSDNLTPMDALARIDGWKRRLAGEGEPVSGRGRPYGAGRRTGETPADSGISEPRVPELFD
ncbi:MAG: DNA mismatch repair protein MutS [Treponema sp.]|nr:DNA mismatch repair protein MutS [Treponema sp.]